MGEMDEHGPDHELLAQTTQSQVQHFRDADPRCRAVQLPDGVVLRYNLSESLYFYLRTAITDGKIASRVFASDSPYEREKTLIGEVITPMFQEMADFQHLKKVEKLLHSWINFVQ